MFFFLSEYVYEVNVIYKLRICYYASSVHLCAFISPVLYRSVHRILSVFHSLCVTLIRRA
ncbi:hypothetical protein SP99_02017 [Enterobacter sp. BIDMC92]|nr:hypothetical protein SP99_02017 [Enterobacter sp. BIDMC92]